VYKSLISIASSFLFRFMCSFVCSSVISIENFMLYVWEYMHVFKFVFEDFIHLVGRCLFVVYYRPYWNAFLMRFIVSTLFCALGCVLIRYLFVFYLYFFKLLNCLLCFFWNFFVRCVLICVMLLSCTNCTNFCCRLHLSIRTMTLLLSTFIPFVLSLSISVFSILSVLHWIFYFFDYYFLSLFSSLLLADIFIFCHLKSICPIEFSVCMINIFIYLLGLFL